MNYAIEHAAMNALKVGQSSIIRTRGARGILAARRFSEGVTIERAPVVVIPRRERGFLRRTTLEDYVFHWGGGCVALALGFGSLYNHSSEPNATVIQWTKERSLEIVALQSIESGDEITIDYGPNLWFTPAADR